MCIIIFIYQLADKINDFCTNDFVTCLKGFPKENEELDNVIKYINKNKWDNFAVGHLTLLHRKISAPI